MGWEEVTLALIISGLSILFLVTSRSDHQMDCQAAANCSDRESRPESAEEVSSVLVSSILSDAALASMNTSGSEYHRQQVFREILETEKSYVQQLNQVVELYLTPLQAEASKESFITLDDVDAIFSCIPVLANFHRSFLQDLESKNITQVFLELSPFLQMYTTYINNFESAMGRLSNLKATSEPFQEFLENAIGKYKGRDLISLLIAPVQRIPRYVLLLREVLHHTDFGHPEHSTLIAALQRIESVAAKINEGKRRIEQSAKLVEIQNRIKGSFEIFKPSRHLIREQDLSVTDQGIFRALKHRNFFLFDDIIMWSSCSSKRFKGSANLTQVEVRECENEQARTSEFLIIIHPKAGNHEAKDQELHIICSTACEKQDWVQDIRKCSEHARKQGQLGASPPPASHESISDLALDMGIIHPSLSTSALLPSGKMESKSPTPQYEAETQLLSQTVNSAAGESTSHKAAKQADNGSYEMI